MDAMKLCGGCSEVKALSEFNKRHASSDGLQSECRVCSKLRAAFAPRRLKPRLPVDPAVVLSREELLRVTARVRARAVDEQKAHPDTRYAYADEDDFAQDAVEWVLTHPGVVADRFRDARPTRGLRRLRNQLARHLRERTLADAETMTGCPEPSPVVPHEHTVDCVDGCRLQAWVQWITPRTPAWVQLVVDDLHPLDARAESGWS